jgi:3-oxoacyl-[acyl-carrier protein] reductase
VPGYINTHRPAEWYPNHNHEARVAGIPVGRGGHVLDIANMAVFLAGYGSYVNGQALHLNGGEFLIG